MPRCFLLRLSRFLALSDIDDDEAIDDGTSEGDDDDEASESDDRALRDPRARVFRRDLRFFFCSGHCLNQKLQKKLQTESRNRPCTRLQARS